MLVYASGETKFSIFHSSFLHTALSANTDCEVYTQTVDKKSLQTDIQVKFSALYAVDIQ